MRLPRRSSTSSECRKLSESGSSAINRLRASRSCRRPTILPRLFGIRPGITLSERSSTDSAVSCPMESGSGSSSKFVYSQR